MFKKLAIAAALAAMPWLGPMSAQSELRSAVNRSMQAMGAEAVKTMVLTGGGFSSIVGQPFSPHSNWWRKFSNTGYVRSIDFDKKAWRLQYVLGEGENPPGGGAGRVTPAPTVTVNTVTLVSPDFQVPAGRGQGIDARAPNFTALVDYAMLPIGFLRTALEKPTTVRSETLKGRTFTVLTFPIEHSASRDGFKTTMSGWINDQGLVERVATTIDNNVLGDIVWDVTYSDWKEFSGVKVPTHIVQHQGEPMFLDLTISDVKINVPVDVAPPGAGRGAGRGEARGEGGEAAEGGEASAAEDLGGGFWLVPGGYAGVIGVFNDYVVAIEGPQSDARAEQIIKEAKRIAPGKPIRYVINTHTHFDHAGGLRAFVAEGATIVTHQGNKGYYEKIFANPHTLVPDTLSTMKPRPRLKVEYIGDKHVISDGTHTIEIHRVAGSTHHAFMTMAYLPKQKILIEADEYNATPKALTATPARINSYEVNLVANLERLNLAVERIVPVHPVADNRKVMLAELKLTAGKP